MGGAAELKGRGTMDDDSEDDDDDEDDEEDDRLIGGIPSKFLDLSHFPHLLRKPFRGGGPGGGQHHRHRDAFVSPEDELGELGGEGGGSGNGKRRRTIIDCTEDDANDASAPRRLPPAPVPSFGCAGDGGGVPGGVPGELAVPDDRLRSSAMPRDDAKRDARRACVSNASLPHVNGTYIRGGTHNGAPLFVRAGGPRKFMGRDCAVVLRREWADDHPPATAGEEQQRCPGGGGGAMGEDGGGRVGPGGGATGHYEWKIGLVPANCVGHPRIISYFLAREENRRCTSSSGPSGGSGRSDEMDWMDEDDLDEEEETHVGPPADGWRVFQEARGAGGKVSTFVSGARTSNLGRASCLRISYE